MKLEVGMYVRFDGMIGKIEDNDLPDEDFIEIEESLKDEYDDYTSLVRKEYIVKSSFNLIDLIEVGDFVNDEKVLSIKEDNKLKIVYVIKYIETSESYFTNDEIKSILTHEQYEANEYIIKE